MAALPCAFTDSERRERSGHYGLLETWNDNNKKGSGGVWATLCPPNLGLYGLAIALMSVEDASVPMVAEREPLP